MFNPQAARERCEAATARVAYWESQWRRSANTPEKEAWYDAVVRDLHDASTGFASAVKALEEIWEIAKDAGCNLPHPSGIPCGDCGSCRTLAILGESE